MYCSHASKNFHQQCYDTIFPKSSAIEFTLGFGCDVPERLDQGVRLEVEIGSGDWKPIRFYTPTLTQSQPSLVHLLPESDEEEVLMMVHARAFQDNNTFPLHFINTSAGPVRINEYLCGNEFADDSVRLRWMQRYVPPSNDSVATWWLDDIRVSRWDGSQLTTVMETNFSDDNISRCVCKLVWNVIITCFFSNYL